MKVITACFLCAALVAACTSTEPPRQTGFEGLTEAEILQKLGPPDLDVLHSAAELYANAEKSSPIAHRLAEIVKQSPSEDIQIKTLAWQKDGFRMARLVKKGKNWVVFGVEELPAGWGNEKQRTPNQ